ncbi:MAG: hypothetical protein PHI52_08110 [Bacteroidales bacterium]|nr:hypothetical protein [Bacteroidales bacterium]
MNKSIIKVILIINMFFLFSCNVLQKEQYKLPDKIFPFKGLLLEKLYGDSLSNLGICILPIIAKDNDIGIYSYTSSGPHRVYYYVFMYNGKTITFSDIDKKEELFLFLKNNSFSKNKLKSLTIKLVQIKQYNKDVNENQIW